MMPVSLVIERHGESESNKAKSMHESGQVLLNENELMEVHTSERRLTPLGIEQAKTAGAWLQQHWYDEEHPDDYRFYVSPYVRAMETAGYNGFGQWKPDVRLVERNWGMFDQLPYSERQELFAKELRLRKDHAFFWRPTNGETLQDVFTRLRDMNATLHRECFNKRVLLVTHGETMWVWRTVLERLLPMQLREQMLADDDRFWIHNCRLIEYTRERGDGSLAERLVRMRFISPEDPENPNLNTGWIDIPRRIWTHEELLSFVNTFRTFISEEECAA